MLLLTNREQKRNAKALTDAHQDTVCFAHVTVIPTLCPAKDAGRAQPPENTEKTKADPPGIEYSPPISFLNGLITIYSTIIDSVKRKTLKFQGLLETRSK